jgi:hypothetical protein
MILLGVARAEAEYFHNMGEGSIASALRVHDEGERKRHG